MDVAVRRRALLNIEEEQLLLLIGIAYLIRNRRRRRAPRARRQIWVKQWILRRPEYGQYENLLQELNREDINGYKNFLRVPPELFLELCERVGPHIEKRDTFWRKSIPVGLRIAVTLRFLATSNSYKSLQYAFRVAHNTISLIIPETCQAICEVFAREVMKTPSTPEEWREVADEFANRWNFHNACGAIDGKHVPIRCPRESGSFYFNYKGFYSIILLALVDAKYKFLYVDVGANGSCSDGGVFKDTDLYKKLDRGTAGLPQAAPLPDDDTPLPYSLIGDDAFGLRSWLLKPYPHCCMMNKERIFNYRLSRARRVVENAFGILVHR